MSTRNDICPKFAKQGQKFSAVLLSFSLGVLEHSRSLVVVVENSMKGTPMKASTEYMTRKQHIEELIKDLQTKLETHTVRAANDPNNWGYAGELGHVEELLSEAVAFIGGGR